MVCPFASGALHWRDEMNNAQRHMRATTVRITGARNPECWYTDKVGELIDVYFLPKEYATLNELDWFIVKSSYDLYGLDLVEYIRYDDCEEVTT
jgi:hypothetical protein